MAKLTSTKLGIALGGLALSLTVGAGIAAAQPDPLVNTTCSYGQVMAALNAQSPDLAQEFNAQPMAQSMLRTFLASPPDQRQRIVQQVQSTPMGQQYFGSIMNVANTCSSYHDQP